MKSKKTRFYRILPTLILGGILVLSGCEKSNDIYNPNHLQEEAKKAFPVKGIDPNQTWETSAICNASVTVNEKTGGAYTIKVYTGNPYNTTGNAYLLAKTSVADGQTANFKFDIPATLQYVYVMKVNSEGYSSAVPVAVENGAMKVTLGETNTRTIESRTTTRASSIKSPDSLPTEAPMGSILLSSLNDQWNGVKLHANYIVTSDIREVNVGKAVNLYIQGNVTLTKLYINGNASLGDIKIYLLPHSTLTFIANQNKEITNVQGEKEIIEFFSVDSGYEIGICKDAKLTCEKGIIFNQKTNVYNCGTISARLVEFNNDSKFINDGKVTLADLFSSENSTTTVENNGEITAGYFHLAGTSSFYNTSTGIVHISKKSLISSNSSTWNNDGYFHSKDMKFASNSKNWINKCKLYVEELLDIQTSDGTIVMDGGSYIECKDLVLDMSRIEMGSGAFFNVTGTASLKWNENNNGFHATGDKYALLKINKAIPFENNLANVHQTYNGKLYIACDNHFEAGGSWWYYQTTNGAQMTGSDNADIKIPSSTCNPGYNSTPDGGGENDKVIEYAYAFEDMMLEAGDYDFNDVVLFVTTPYSKEGKKVIDVTLKAAGATKKLAVLFNNGTTTTTLLENVHTALGVAEGTIVNTGGTKGNPSTVTIEVGANFNLTNNGDFYISDGKRDVHIPNFTPNFTAGDAPYALRIACADWKWPKERIQITEAYSGFEDWAKDATQTADWYNNPNSNKVIGIE